MEFSQGVKVEWEPGVHHQGLCPLCRVEAEHKAILKISTGAERMPYDATFLCAACEGVFSYPFVYPDYSEDYSFPDYTRYYCEIGAGVGSMIEAVQNVCRARHIGSMIDVGCGTPFTADFARRHLGVDAKGVDPSNYAKQYAGLMEVPLSSALLGFGSQFDSQKFDLVFSSEVVEHVEDPVGFVELLADYVAPNGILVLTTPSAEFVAERPSPLDTMSSI
ncbi:MAG: class I SAM-dependent methyltransferase [Pontibacterium sp.]